MNLTDRNVTDNFPPSPSFYCYLKMVIKYLGMRPGRCLGLGGWGFSLGERAPGGAQSWLLEGPVPAVGTGLPSPDLCVLCFRLLPWCSLGLHLEGEGWPLTPAALCRGAAWKQCGQAHSAPLRGARVPWRAGMRGLQSWAQHPKREVKINDHGHQGPLRPVKEFTSSMQTLFKKRRGRGRRRRNEKEEGRRRATLP